MSVIDLPKFQKEPGFCPLHSSPAPCLFCLSPEVAQLVGKYHKNEKKIEGFLFMKADENQN